MQFVVTVSLLSASAFVARPRIVPVHRRSRTPLMGTAELKKTLIDTAAEFRAAQAALWSAKEASSDESSAPLGASSVANIDLTDDSLSALRNQTIVSIEALAACNPTAAPLAGWRTAAGCGLEGTWSLLFTTAVRLLHGGTHRRCRLRAPMVPRVCTRRLTPHSSREREARRPHTRRSTRAAVAS
jgi:hypothetical protein